MTGEPDGRDDALLGRLRQQTRQLVAELPGPLRRVRLRSGETMVEVEWPDAAAATAAAGPPFPAPGTEHGAGNAASPPAGAVARTPDGAPPAAAAAAGNGAGTGTATPAGSEVVAPIVGTFYRAPEPGAEPFVQVGDLVEAGQVVGIVEAMKLMNQVTAERAGRITAVLVRDGEAVQFGQPLIQLAAA